jgi:hypothetical protein
MLDIFTAASIEQFCALPLSKITASPEPGTEAPGAPPEVVDQFKILFQLERSEPTQYRLAAFAPAVKKRKKVVKRHIRSRKLYTNGNGFHSLTLVGSGSFGINIEYQLIGFKENIKKLALSPFFKSL